MKKFLICKVIAILLSVLLFTIPTQAMSIYWLASYARKQSGYDWTNGLTTTYHVGSEEYWRIRIYEEKSWVGANRPEKLMGDANIDGKVDARDALVALYFGLYGNVQTADVCSIKKTPSYFSWESHFSAAYRNGSLEKHIDSEICCWYYCLYNSPFFADVTKDCVVNSLDALQILKYAVGKAKNFPEGDFTTISRDFKYYPWPTEYYPGIFDDLEVDMTIEEFCQKYNYYPDATPTDQ